MLGTPYPCKITTASTFLNGQSYPYLDQVAVTLESRLLFPQETRNTRYWAVHMCGVVLSYLDPAQPQRLASKFSFTLPLPDDDYWTRYGYLSLLSIASHLGRDYQLPSRLLVMHSLGYLPSGAEKFESGPHFAAPEGIFARLQHERHGSAMLLHPSEE